jgi:uncharacterized protein (TIGR02453 family)
MSDYAGLPKATFELLKGIAANNDKEWFQAHRALYDEGYVDAGKTLVVALGPRIAKFDRAVKYEPRIGGSLMRINRDVRFSKDKSPYKTHLDAWLWTGEEKGWDSPGYFFRMFADRLMLGAGMHAMEKPALERYREAVVDPKKGKALEKAVAEVAASPLGMNIGGASRKKVPRGYDADHPRARFLLHDGLWADWDGKVPKEAKSAAFLDFCVARFEAAAPIARWLRSALG